MAIIIDSVPPEVRVPQGFPYSSFTPIKSDAIATTSSYICLTRGNVSACKGLVYANNLARLMINFE